MQLAGLGVLTLEVNLDAMEDSAKSRMDLLLEPEGEDMSGLESNRIRSQGWSRHT